MSVIFGGEFRISLKHILDIARNTGGCPFGSNYPIFHKKYRKEHACMILSEKQLFCIHFLYSQPHLITKRASSCISGLFNRKQAKAKVKGSLTIETAMILPFFFLALICMFYMLEVMVIRTYIRNGMQCAVKKTIEKSYGEKWISLSELEQEIINSIGADRLERSIVSGGSEGISCEGSYMSMYTGVLELHVKYRVKIPVASISDLSVPMEETMKAKGWNGYTGSGFWDTQNEVVYVTENGMVYHKDAGCNYLELSIQQVDAGEIGDIRNQSQGIYHACEACVHGSANAEVYITDYGERYHNSLNCIGLKRTIYAIPLSEAVGKGVCSKCGR